MPKSVLFLICLLTVKFVFVYNYWKFIVLVPLNLKIMSSIKCIVPFIRGFSRGLEKKPKIAQGRRNMTVVASHYY